MEQSTTQKPIVKEFFDPSTNTISYVVTDPETKHCAVIDSVADYEPHSARLTHTSADTILTYIQENNLTLEWVLETHMHADHITAAHYLQEKTGALIGMGKEIQKVNEVFGKVFFKEDSAQNLSMFNRLFSDNESFMIGNMSVTVLHVPGHTPADVAYHIGDSVFAGDTIFMPDYGSARCDFPGGSADELYNSVQRLFSLPDTTRLFMCHDYLPEGRSQYLFETTIGEEKAKNIHLNVQKTKESFVALRQEKDKTLGMPRLIIPSLQANLLAGKTPTICGKEGFLVPVNGIFSH